MTEHPDAMKVRALKSFAPLGLPPVVEGDEFDLPDGTDWIECKLVVPVAPPKAKPPKAKTSKK